MADPKHKGKQSPQRPQERKYGRPAPGAQQPAVRKYGRPAPGPSTDQQGERRYGRPAPGGPQPPARKYGRPAPGPSSDQPGEKRYGRPAPGAQQPPVRKYGRPAPGPTSDQPGEKRYGRPAPGSPQPPVRKYGRPAPVSPRPGRAFQQDPAKRRPDLGPKDAPILSKDARVAALMVLGRVLDGGAYASLSLDEVFQNMRLSPQDKRLAAVIVYKTIEDLLKIDFALGQFLEDAEALNGKIRNILRLSACQILLMDRIPDFAATNEAVELTRASGFEAMTGLVNGVLRSLIRGKDSLPWPREGEENHLSITHSIPQWLADLILASYPREQAEGIIKFRSDSHAVTLRRNRMLTTREEFQDILSKKSWELEDGQLAEVIRVKGAGSLGQDPDFLAGRFSIQGEGSMMAAMAVDPRAGMTVLDCCAAPGGKTCLMAELMQNTGRVHAWDVHEHRVDLIYAQAERLRLYNIRPAVRDATVYQERFEQTMDAVLLDAPCSGTGVMDNKPDIKYRLTKEGLEELVALQARLLEVSARYVKPGGVLVYATCSLLPQENAEQVRQFLEHHKDFQLDALPDSIPEAFRAKQKEYGLQLLPHEDQVDGFFIARMKRSN